MKWTTEEAFSFVSEAGVTQNRAVFYRMVREGKIPASMQAKKKGYRFFEKDVREFVSGYLKDEAYAMADEMKRLREENEKWRKAFQMPKDIWMRENQELKRRMKEQQLTIEMLEKEVHDLKEQLEKMKDDRTIRIRVE